MTRRRGRPLKPLALTVRQLRYLEARKGGASQEEAIRISGLSWFDVGDTEAGISIRKRKWVSGTCIRERP